MTAGTDKDLTMMTTDYPSILAGSREKGGVIYICRPGDTRNTWIAYDLEPGGALLNPRVVFGAQSDLGWRGLPEFE